MNSALSGTTLYPSLPVNMTPPPNRRVLRVIPPPTRRVPAKAPISIHKYDESSGQVYNETIVNGISAGDLYWPYRGSYRPERELEVRPPGSLGAPSLFQTALRQAVDNAQSLTVDVLQYLPCSLVKPLWAMIYNE